MDVIDRAARAVPAVESSEIASTAANDRSVVAVQREDAPGSEEDGDMFWTELLGATAVAIFLTAIYGAVAMPARARPRPNDPGGTIVPFGAGVLLAAWAGGAWFPFGPAVAGAHCLPMAFTGTVGAVVLSALVPMGPTPGERPSFGGGSIAVAHADAARSTTGVGVYYWLFIVLLGIAIFTAYVVGASETS
jgi:hypothetical protein